MSEKSEIIVLIEIMVLIVETLANAINLQP